MGIKFSKPIPTKQKDLDLFSQQIGFTLTKDMQQYFLGFNGAVPAELNAFDVSDDNGSCIQLLIPLSEIVEIRQDLDPIGEHVYPIALTDSGDYLVVDFSKDSSVYFWDHEMPEDGILLATNIYAFLSNNLRPFSREELEYNEDDATVDWVDPEFQKLMDEGKL